MYCTSCGQEVPNNMIYCPNCGTKVVNQVPAQQNAYSYQPVPATAPRPVFDNPNILPGKKEPVLAAILSFFITGLGQIYAGKVGRGLGFLFGMILSILFFWLLIPIILIPILWVWSIFDASSIANRYNYFIRKNQRPPGPGEFW